MPAKTKPADTPRTWVFEFDGDSFTYVPGRNTARIVRDVRRLTGMSIIDAAKLLATAPDIDATLPLYVAAAMQAGVTPDVEALLDRVTQDNPIRLRLVDGVPDPEPPGGS